MSRIRIKNLFRFSLGTMLVVVTVLCVWLGLKVRQAESQKEAVAWVREMGGRVSYDYLVGEDGYFKEPPTEIASPPGPDWLRELIGLDYFSTVTGVVLVRSKGTVSDLSPLAKLPRLRSLTFRGAYVSEDALAEFETAAPNCKVAYVFVR